ncbi:spore germination protein GerPB [Bacillus niameyensis]|uniref:spore germination protein GerPB n=1 Tax=Bacillus niameyensis TaxID=1522308 RepID=UPI0007819A1B|nr:spore germination protein GerPB [Bacillus niameyensis]
MKINVQQTICIQTIKIGAITNSSVLQIGTSGIITPSAHLYNTGGFKAAAPQVPKGEIATEFEEATQQPTLVPLT